jgi:hypothetical protein
MNGVVGSWPSPVAHRARGGRSSSGLVTGGSVASTWVNSAWSQGWSPALGALVTPVARTSPVAGRNTVNSLAVPPRMDSCGRSAGLPTGAQVAPGCGIAWYGPASSWHQRGTPAASASRYARSMAPCFLPSADRPPGPRRLCACAAPCRSGTRFAFADTTCRPPAAPAGSSARPPVGAPPDEPSAPTGAVTRLPSHRASDPAPAGPSPRSARGPAHRRAAAVLAPPRSSGPQARPD